MQREGYRSMKKGKFCRQNDRGFFQRFLSGIGKTLAFFLSTVVILLATFLAAVYITVNGPSPSARNLFVMSVKETSAAGFLADLFLSREQVESILEVPLDVGIQTDTTLISISETEPQKANEPDAWGLVDEDGDGIILQRVTGSGYSGYMMIVQDPKRVIMGCVPEHFYVRGYTVAEMVEQFDAVAGINAGGFYDPDGSGNGSIPDSMVVYEGAIYNNSTQKGFVGFDKNGILHVGSPTREEVEAMGIQYGVCFGPVLIANGQRVLPDGIVSGLNPRTAIGQRSDGAVLLLVIDGRQVVSLGATLGDLTDIFLRYGAVNACNLDGGSSTLMWYQGDYINNCASVVGIRPVPTTFLVLKERGSCYEG